MAQKCQSSQPPKNFHVNDTWEVQSCAHSSKFNKAVRVEYYLVEKPKTKMHFHLPEFIQEKQPEPVKQKEPEIEVTLVKLENSNRAQFQTPDISLEERKPYHSRTPVEFSSSPIFEKPEKIELREKSQKPLKQLLLEQFDSSSEEEQKSHKRMLSPLKNEVDPPELFYDEEIMGDMLSDSIPHSNLGSVE